MIEMLSSRHMKIDRKVGKRPLKSYSSYSKTCFREKPTRRLDPALLVTKVLRRLLHITLKVPVPTPNAVPLKLILIETGMQASTILSVSPTTFRAFVLGSEALCSDFSFFIFFYFFIFFFINYTLV